MTLSAKRSLEPVIFSLNLFSGLQLFNSKYFYYQSKGQKSFPIPFRRIFFVLRLILKKSIDDSNRFTQQTKYLQKTN